MSARIYLVFRSFVDGTIQHLSPERRGIHFSQKQFRLNICCAFFFLFFLASRTLFKPKIYNAMVAFPVDEHKTAK